MDIKDLKRLKRETGMTNAEISDLSSVPISTVNKIFSGATENPRYATLLAIEDVLRKKQKLPFRYDENRQEPCLVQEEATAYCYKSREYSVEDIFELDERIGYELIDGEIYMMSAPNRMHQFLLGEIVFAMKSFIKQKKGGCCVYPAPLGVQLFQDDKTWVEPDIVVVCEKDKLTDKGVSGAPDLVVEVVSPSNSSYDYLLKMTKYQQAGVREYWIVDPKLEIVLVYNFEDFHKSGRYEYSDEIVSNVLEGFEICIKDFIDEY